MKKNATTQKIIIICIKKDIVYLVIPSVRAIFHGCTETLPENLQYSLKSGITMNFKENLPEFYDVSPVNGSFPQFPRFDGTIT